MFAKELIIWFLTGTLIILMVVTVVMTVVYEVRFRGKVIGKRVLRRPLFTILTVSGVAGLAMGFLAVTADFIAVPLSLPAKIIANLGLVVACSLGAALLFGFTFLLSLHRADHLLENGISIDIVQTLYTLLRKDTDE